MTAPAVVEVEARHLDYRPVSMRRDPRNPEGGEARWRDVVPDMDPTALPDLAVLVADGAPIMLKAKVPGWLSAPLRQALIAYPCDNGVVRGAGIRNRSRVFGNLSRNGVLRRAACASCSGATDHPEAHAAIVGAAGAFAAILADHLPDQHAANRAAVASVLPEWLMPGGLWTSGVVNLSSALPFHRDRNNFDAWSVMPTFRRGVRGGHLAFPEILVGGKPLVLPCADGDVVYFNGQNWLHGVTPLRPVAADGYRYSAVYYPVARMANCLTFDEELAEARRRRTNLEDSLIDRQRRAGYLNAEVDALGIHEGVGDDA